MKDKREYFIRAVSNALDVLSTICQSSKPLSLKELAEKTPLHKNNIFRILATLEIKGYIECDLERTAYRPSAKCIHMFLNSFKENWQDENIKRLVAKVAKQVKETTHFAVLNQEFIFYPFGEECKKEVRTASKVFQSAPALSLPTGRMLIANSSENGFSKEFINSNKETIKNIKDALKGKTEIIEVNNEEELLTVAVMVNSAQNAGIQKTLGAIEVTAPLFRARGEDILKAVRDEIRKTEDLKVHQFLEAGALERKVEKEVVKSGRKKETGKKELPAHTD